MVILSQKIKILNGKEKCIVEIKINTKFEELDRVFMLKREHEYDGSSYNVFIPVEVSKIISVEHEINQYQVDIFNIKYCVESLETKEKFDVYESGLYTIDSLTKILHDFGQ